MMTALNSTLHAAKRRMGDLWWYTVILFAAQRLGDVIHAAIGLWLVPLYVPQSELGAVLPLMSVGGLLGFPLTALMTPFMKFLNKYMALGEFGKAKRLLCDTFILTGVMLVGISLVSRLLLPLVFERMRVEDGSLSVLIIVSGVVAAVVPVFSTALQALKKFAVLSAASVLGAIVRLGTMILCLPIRGLSGYFVGQIVPNLFTMGVALVALREQFGRAIKMVPYWSDDWKPILRYARGPALLNLAGLLQITIEAFVVRRCLPDVESAGYYMITRFAEITLYFGFSCTTVLFPLVAERHEKGQHGQRLLAQSVGITALAGFGFTAILAPCARLLFALKPDWNVYACFVPHLATLSLIYAIRGAVHCFATYQIARNQTRFILFFVSMHGAEMAVLYGLTGYMFFAPWMPQAWLDALTAFNPCRLTVVLSVMLLGTLATLLYAIASTAKMVRANRIGTQG